MIELQELAAIGLPPHLSKCFVPLPYTVDPSAGLAPESLYEAFHRVFRCPEAKATRDVVFIWAVEKPYTHAQGRNTASHLVYIEKTKSSMWLRWSTENLRRLTTDFNDRITPSDPRSLRSHAEANRNFAFYSRVVKDHGPLRIWWASSSALNEVAGCAPYNSEAWEGHLLALYTAYHGCRPLKNRKGGKGLLDIATNFPRATHPSSISRPIEKPST